MAKKAKKKGYVTVLMNSTIGQDVLTIPFKQRVPKTMLLAKLSDSYADVQVATCFKIPVLIVYTIKYQMTISKGNLLIRGVFFQVSFPALPT